jgi:hypothetical protein
VVSFDVVSRKGERERGKRNELTVCKCVWYYGFLSAMEGCSRNIMHTMNYSLCLRILKAKINCSQVFYRNRPTGLFCFCVDTKRGNIKILFYFFHQWMSQTLVTEFIIIIVNISLAKTCQFISGF